MEGPLRWDGGDEAGAPQPQTMVDASTSASEVEELQRAQQLNPKNSDPGHGDRTAESLKGISEALGNLRTYLEAQFDAQAGLLQALRAKNEGSPAGRSSRERAETHETGQWSWAVNSDTRLRSPFTIQEGVDGRMSPGEVFSVRSTMKAENHGDNDVTAIEEGSDSEISEERRKDLASRATRKSLLGTSLLQRHLKSQEDKARNKDRMSYFNSASLGLQGLRKGLRNLVEAGWFAILVLLLIVINAVLLGIEIDAAFSMPEADIPAWFGWTNTAIVIFFVVEIAMKLLAYGCADFWRGDQAGWNIFDFVIVALSAAETALDIFATTLANSMWGSDALSVVRTMRLARALRGVRFFRLFRHFSALRALILSIVSTMGSLMWTLVLLTIVFYSFGVIIMQLVTDYCRFLAIESAGSVNVVPQCPDELNLFWSSMGQSMLTLFFAITGGISWAESMRPLEKVSVLAVATMLFYIVLSVFTILNVVTGVFVNTAIDRAGADKEIASLKALQKRNEQMRALQELFEEIDLKNTNDLNVQDIENAHNVEKLDTVLASLGITTEDIKTLFSLIDADGSGTIDLEEFVSGCMQLHGPARSVQLAKISYENKQITTSIRDLSRQFSFLHRKVMMAATKGDKGTPAIQSIYI